MWSKLLFFYRLQFWHQSTPVFGIVQSYLLSSSILCIIYLTWSFFPLSLWTSLSEHELNFCIFMPNVIHRVFTGCLAKIFSAHVLTILFLCRWEKPGHSPLFGYDFWYQPRHKTMISSSWGAPSAFTKGFNPQHVSDGLYGRQLYVYSWPDGELKQTLDLGPTGLLPLEVKVWNIKHFSVVTVMAIST